MVENGFAPACLGAHKWNRRRLWLEAMEQRVVLISDMVLAVGSLDVQNLVGKIPDALVAVQQTNTVVVQVPTANPKIFTPVQTLVGASTSQLAPSAVQWAKLEGKTGLFDAVVVASGSNSVLVYHPKSVDSKTGDPTFVMPPISYPVGTDPVAVTIQDINGDGIPDMLVANKGSNDVSILFGSVKDGIWHGTPGPRLESGGSGPLGAEVVQVAGQSQPSLVITNSDSTVSVLPGVGQGLFDDQQGSIGNITVPGKPIGPIVAGFLPTTRGIFRINVDTLSVKLVFPSDNLSAMNVADDGKVVVAGFENGELELLNLTNQRLTPSFVFQNPGLTSPSAVEDFPNNGRPVIYATTAGSDRVFVFGLSDGIPIPKPTLPFVPPSQRPHVEPVGNTATFLIAVITSSSEEPPPIQEGLRAEAGLGVGVGGLAPNSTTGILMISFFGDGADSVGEPDEEAGSPKGDGANFGARSGKAVDSASALNQFIMGSEQILEMLHRQIRDSRGIKPEVTPDGSDGPDAAWKRFSIRTEGALDHFFIMLPENGSSKFERHRPHDRHDRIFATDVERIWTSVDVLSRSLRPRDVGSLNPTEKE